MSHDGDQSAAKQTKHTPGRWKQKHPDRQVQPYKAELRPSVPDQSARTLFSLVAGVQSLPGTGRSVGGAGLSAAGGSEVLFSLLHLPANTVFCMCVFVIADRLAQTAAMLAESTKRHRMSFQQAASARPKRREK